MCFRVAAYKELELLINLQLEVFYCQLWVLDYCTQSLDLRLPAELQQGFVQGCPRVGGQGVNGGGVGYLPWLFAWGGSCVPHSSLRAGMAKAQGSSTWCLWLQTASRLLSEASECVSSTHPLPLLIYFATGFSLERRVGNEPT